MKAPKCLECGKRRSKRNRFYCGHACMMRATNRTANPAKTDAARAKIAAAAALRGNAHMMTPDARAKAVAGISKATRGRSLTDEHKAHIGAGVRRAGCKPPRNSHLVGRVHPNWIDGSSTIRNKAFNSPEYAAFRTACISRDNWTCRDCGKRGGRLEVHHVEPWGPHPELRYAISNGVTLCRHCHLARHRNQPRPVTTGPRVVADLPSNQPAA